ANACGNFLSLPKDDLRRSLLLTPAHPRLHREPARPSIGSAATRGGASCLSESEPVPSSSARPGWFWRVRQSRGICGVSKHWHRQANSLKRSLRHARQGWSRAVQEVPGKERRYVTHDRTRHLRTGCWFGGSCGNARAPTYGSDTDNDFGLGWRVAGRTYRPRDRHVRGGPSRRISGGSRRRPDRPVCILIAGLSKANAAELAWKALGGNGDL